MSKNLNQITNFYHDQSGAVTVDWVVLTAGIIGLGTAVLTSVGAGTTDLATRSGSAIAGTEMGVNFFYYPLTARELLQQNTDALGINASPTPQKVTFDKFVADAPAGYAYTGKRVDLATEFPIYTSDDGLTYMIGKEVISVADYQASGAPSKSYLQFWNGIKNEL